MTVAQICSAVTSLRQATLCRVAAVLQQRCFFLNLLLELKIAEWTVFFRKIFARGLEKSGLALLQMLSYSFTSVFGFFSNVSHLVYVQRKSKISSFQNRVPRSFENDLLIDDNVFGKFVFLIVLIKLSSRSIASFLVFENKQKVADVHKSKNQNTSRSLY